MKYELALVDGMIKVTKFKWSDHFQEWCIMQEDEYNNVGFVVKNGQLVLIVPSEI